MNRVDLETISDKAHRCPNSPSTQVDEDVWKMFWAPKMEKKKSERVKHRADICTSFNWATGWAAENEPEERGRAVSSCAVYSGLLRKGRQKVSVTHQPPIFVRKV